jgi:sec-independent protein translocase protein TatB
MLGLGWTEMLVIGIVALIFIGPKDLPVVMGKVGKVIGQIQRMGREFQREINKTTGLDEVRNLRTSITSPLKKTADEIRKEFNAIGKDGQEQPSGALKPTDPNVESVVDAIQQQAGMTPPKKSNDELAAEYRFMPTVLEEAAPSPPAPAAAEPVKAVRPAPKAAKPKVLPAEPASPGAIADVVPAKPKTGVKRTAKTAAPVIDAQGAPVEAPAKKPRAPRKKPVETAGKAE